MSEAALRPHWTCLVSPQLPVPWGGQAWSLHWTWEWGRDAKLRSPVWQRENPAPGLEGVIWLCALEGSNQTMEVTAQDR